MSGPLYYPPSQNAVQKTLGAQLLAGGVIASLSNVTGIQNKAGICVIDRVDTNGVETPDKREYISFTGTSGSTLVGLVRNVDGSGTDQDHAIGSIVEFIPDVIWAQSISDALANIVDTSTLDLDTTKVVTPTGSQTLTNKTITGGTITGPTINTPNLVLGSDATGDMYYRGSGASLVRLPIGSVNQVLTMNASLPVWAAAGASSNPPSQWVTAVNSSLIDLDFKLGTKFMVTVVPGSVSTTFRPSNVSLSQVALLRVQYASTASFAMNLFTVNATTCWAGGTAPTPTATLNKADMFGFVCMATLPKFDAFVVGQNI